MTLLCEGHRIVFGVRKLAFAFSSSRLAGVPCGYSRILKIDSNAFFLPQVRSLHVFMSSCLHAIELRHLLLYLHQLTDPRGRQQAGY
ncbi:hypothetical protein SCG7086_CK_00080 [Chlamydiales bacterium SCGC AG-110-P3]|nr:hypothetical protein SCG7086_CK_00080 [Chlamydiales bacterium SCGC AG-110-P3]